MIPFCQTLSSKKCRKFLSKKTSWQSWPPKKMLGHFPHKKKTQHLHPPVWWEFLLPTSLPLGFQDPLQPVATGRNGVSTHRSGDLNRNQTLNSNSIVIADIQHVCLCKENCRYTVACILISKILYIYCHGLHAGGSDMEPNKNQPVIKFPAWAKSAKRWANEVEEMEDLGRKTSMSFLLGDTALSQFESLGFVRYMPTWNDMNMCAYLTNSFDVGDIRVFHSLSSPTYHLT